MTKTDLAEFLLARITEDETFAREASRHDPARVLADCEAKRRIIEEVVPQIRGFESQIEGEWGTGDLPDTEVHQESDQLLRLLAAPYADHTDYREEWAP